MSDEHLEEMARQAMQVTPLGRLTNHEVLASLSWLIDNGHIERTGKPLDRPLPPPRVVAREPDGKPIYEAGADFRTHEVVTHARAC